jgi:hypothetical protein
MSSMQASSVLLFVVGMMTGIRLAMITDLVRDPFCKRFLARQHQPLGVEALCARCDLALVVRFDLARGL